MKGSRCISIDFHRPESSLLARAADILRDDGVIVAPTETQYGMICNALARPAINRVYELKQRPRSMPMAIFARSVQHIVDYGSVSPEALALAHAFLPGPLTLVIPASDNLPEPPADNGKIGIRVSSAPIVERLRALVDFPLSATSANLSGQSTPTTAPEIEAIFGDGVALYLDAGPCDRTASTVVDSTTTPVTVLREGAISRADIEKVTKEFSTDD